jgi:hypothetical protein
MLNNVHNYFGLPPYNVIFGSVMFPNMKRPSPACPFVAFLMGYFARYLARPGDNLISGPDDSHVLRIYILLHGRQSPVRTSFSCFRVYILIADKLDSS